jgi:hypothetical protein
MIIIETRQAAICLLATFVITVLPLNAANPEPRKDVVRCSVINLIATPERYVGKQIVTMGVLRVEFEGDGIYPSTELAEKGVDRIVVLMDEELRSSRRHLDRKWVTIVGRFREGPRGDLTNGIIDQVTVLLALD